MKCCAGQAAGPVCGTRYPAKQELDALWPGRSPDASAANLRKATHFARHAPGPPDMIALTSHVVAATLDQKQVIDAEAFDAETKAALRADGCRQQVDE